MTRPGRRPGRMRDAVWSGWQRLRYGPRVLLLAYHRVADDGPEPLGLSVSLRNFEEHLEVLKGYGRPVRFDGIRQATRRGTTPEAFCVTFDDGYADNLHHAKPLLEKFDVPATVFVASGFLGTEAGFPWDGDRPAPAVLTPDELVRLADGELLEVGAHTRTHPRLPSLPTGAQRTEIVSGKTALEEIVGRPVLSFAYPFGAYSSTTVALVKETGFRQACTVEKGTAWRQTDPWRIPRLLARDRDGDDLARRLRRWFGRPPAREA